MVSLGDDLNRRLLRDFRLYMLVGGMPQAVDTYRSTNNLSIVDQVKRNILELYADDFRKIDPTGRAGTLFDSIPAQLNKNASRYQVSSVIAGEKEERVREILDDMQDSMTVYIAYHADNPSAGMAFHKDPRRYKLFLCDTGLFTTLAFKDRDFTENEIYEKLLSDKLGTDLGYLYENIVAQMLKTAGNELFYYTFPKESSNQNCEIDFLVARKNKICPLEIKSSGYKRHASLDAFQDKFSERVLRRYLIYTKDARKDRDIFCLPVYMVPFLQKLEGWRVINPMMMPPLVFRDRYFSETENRYSVTLNYLLFLSRKEIQNSFYTQESVFIINCRSLIGVMAVYRLMDVMTVHMVQKRAGRAISLIYMAVPSAHQNNRSLFRFDNRFFLPEKSGAEIGLEPASDIQ